jgi:carbamoyl-phosphate synthase large subunit
MKKKLVIGVTALNAIDSPGPGVAVIRAIRESKDFEVRIIGLAYEAMEPGLYMHDLVDKTYQIPYPSGGTEPLLARLEYIQEKENMDLIIPNFDAELFNFIKLQDKLSDMGIRTFLPDLDQLEARDKMKLAAFGKKNGFFVPEEHYLHELIELKRMEPDLKYPVMVKGKYYDAIVANSFDQVEKAFQKIQAKWGLPIILQEFIKGTEINIAALGDGEGNTISVIPMRKLYITEKGKAWAGVTLDDELLIDLGRKFIKATHWRGGCELEVMLTSTGKPFILEVNPRFPAWIYLTAAAGQNQPASLVKMALGERVAPFTTYAVGKIFIRYAWDLVTDISEFQKISGNGEL